LLHEHSASGKSQEALYRTKLCKTENNKHSSRPFPFASALSIFPSLHVISHWY